MSQHQDVTLGVPPDGQSRRDAIHIAVIPARAKDNLKRGDRVMLRYNDETLEEYNECIYAVPAVLGENYHGIVDPFAEGPIAEGQTCWIVLRPGTVSNLRHDWDHPALISTRELSPLDVDWLDHSCRGC